MARLGPLDRIGAMPADTVRVLRMIPEIAESTRAMEAHTALLAEIATVLERVAADTKVLPKMRKDTASIDETVRVLHAMDARLADIEGAMPVLVDVQRHLAQLPETMERLSGLIEKMLVALDELNESVGTLQGAVEPVGRLASRVPGRRKGESH